METEKNTITILLDQLTQSKALVLFLLMMLISCFGYIIPAWSWFFLYTLYGSIYFTFYLFAIALTTAIHEREHITKLIELGYLSTNFRVNRIGDVSFWIENLDEMSANELYQNAIAPFLAPLVYLFEILSLLILVVMNIIFPFALGLVLLFFTTLAFVSLVGSFCALLVIRERKTSGFCVRLARIITSRGDIDEIVSWNMTSKISI